MAKNVKISWREQITNLSTTFYDIFDASFLPKAGSQQRMAPKKIFSWAENIRGLSKDFERLLES